MSFNFEEKRGDYWEERHSFIHCPMYSFFSWGSLVPNAQLDWPGTKSHLKGKSDLVKFGDFNLSPLVTAFARLFSKSFSFQKSAIFLSNQALWPNPRLTWHQNMLLLKIKSNQQIFVKAIYSKSGQLDVYLFLITGWFVGDWWSPDYWFFFWDTLINYRPNFWRIWFSPESDAFDFLDKLINYRQ